MVECDCSRSPRLVASNEVSGPIAAGIFGGSVVLPKRFVGQVSASDLADVLVHEVAHVVRRDPIVVLVQNLVAAIYWPHPLVKKLNRELAKAREEVCDNFVLASTDAPVYSRTLLSLTELVQHPETIQGSVGFFASRWKLEQRVAGLLDEQRDRTTVLSKRGWLFVAVASILLAIVTCLGTITIAEAKDPGDSANAEIGDDESSVATMTVSGTILGPEKQPVAAARVVVLRTFQQNVSWNNAHEALRETQTDERGEYSVTVPATSDRFSSEMYLVEQSTSVLASKTGYAPSEKLVASPNSVTDLTLKQSKVPILGTLLDLEGRPVSGVRVRVEQIENARASTDVDQWLIASNDNPTTLEELSMVSSSTSDAGKAKVARFPSTDGFKAVAILDLETVTDERGKFMLDGLGDDCLVTLRVDSRKISSTLISVLTRPVQSVNMPIMDPRHRVGKVFGNQFSVSLEPCQMIRGQVRDRASSEPIAGVTIDLAGLPGSMMSVDQFITTTTDKDGRYELVGVPKRGAEETQPIRLLVRPNPDQPYFRSTPKVPRGPGLDPIDFDIELTPAVWVEGKIAEMVTDKPVPAMVAYYPYLSNLNADGHEAFNKSIHTMGYDDMYPTDLEGRFRIPALPGKGVLRVVAANDGLYEMEPVPGQNIGMTERVASRPQRLYHVMMPGNAVVELDIDDGQSVTEVDAVLKRLPNRSIRVTAANGDDATGYFVAGRMPTGRVTISGRGTRYWGRQPVSQSKIEIVMGNETEIRRPIILHDRVNHQGAVFWLDKISGDPTTETSVQLKPCVKIIGELVDSSGDPIAKGNLRVGVGDIGIVRSMGSEGNGKIRVTRSKHLTHYFERLGGEYSSGRFELVVPPCEDLSMFLAGSPTEPTLLENTKMIPGETLDLGTINVEADPKTWPQPTRTLARDSDKLGDLPHSNQSDSHFAGRVVNGDGDPIAGAKIWLAITSFEFNSEANHENRQGLLRELGSADQQGRFEFVLDEAATQKIRTRPRFAQTQLVAMAEGYGLGWMLLDVFADNPTASKERELLQSRIDEALGDGRFASRTIELRRESKPVRGRLVDLEGNPLPNVKVLVESLSQPDMPQLLNALENSSAQGLNGAINATGIVRGLARSELQRFIPPVTTDAKGEFAIRGIGDDQLVTLVLAADRVDARPLHVLGREMKTVSLPHNKLYPGGTKDMFVGRDFAYAVSPSVPVEGVVTDFDTGQPVANVLVAVERLFKAEDAKLRLDTHHMRAVTDEQGRFRIIGMPPGDGHIVEAVPPKSEPYLPAQHEVSLRLEDGEAKHIKIQVKQGVWIEGRITDKQSGEPRAAAVDYMALSKNPHTLGIPGLDRKLGLDPVRFHQRYVTDSNGQYRLLGLPGPGVLLVTSLVPGYPLASGAETIDGYDASGGTLPTTPFRVPASNWHLLKQIDPAPNQDTVEGSFGSDLELDAGVSIPGRVVGPEGKAITDLHVLGLTEQDQYWSPKYQDKVRLTDRFKVNGYDGKGPRQLFFKIQDETLVGQYRIEGGAPEEIAVTLEPSVRVTGRLIESATDLPAPRYFISCKECSLNEQVPPAKFMIHWCHTDDEGRFEIKGLMAGLTYKMYTLNESNNINKDNNFTIDLTAAKPGELVELGDVPGPIASEKTAPQSPSAMASPKSATLSEGTTDVKIAPSSPQTIRGVILGMNEMPIRNAMVAVIVSKNTGKSCTSTMALGEAQSNERGEFQIPVAFSEEMIHARLIARTKDSALQSLDLNLKSLEENYSVKLEPSVPLRIRLVDLEGQPANKLTLERRDIRNVSSHLAAAPPRMTTDSDGNVTIDHIAANDGVLLEISGSDRFAPQTLSINTDAPEKRPERDATYRYNVRKVPKNKTVTIPLAPSQPFSGQVFLGDSDQPAANAPISIWSSQQQESGSMITLDSTTDENGRFQLNPYPGVRYGIQVYPPKDTPYQSVQLRDLRWNSGEETSKMKIRLPQGAIAEGQVTNGATGDPIAGVYVQYLADSKNPNKTSGFIEGWQAIVRTDAHGRFRATALPGRGTLIAHAGGSKPFVMKITGSREVRLGKPGGTRYYAHAFEKIDLDPSTNESPSVSIQLQPSVPLNLRLVDPDGNAIQHASYTSVLAGSPITIRYRGSPEIIASGQAIIHGLAKGDKRRIHVWSEDRKLGAAATLIGGKETQTVTLSPAGSATMRFVNPSGDPIADQPTARFSSLQFIMTDKPSQAESKNPNEAFRRDMDFYTNFNRNRRNDEPRTDSDGQVTLDDLIPGVTYKIYYPRDGEGDSTEFSVEPGQRLDLGDITTDGPEDLR